MTPTAAGTPTSRAGSARPTPSSGAAGSCRRRWSPRSTSSPPPGRRRWPTRRSWPSSTAPARLRRRALPALRRHPAVRAGRRPDPAQARGPQPHRRAQDPQRAGPGAADQADGQDARDRRDRRRPARRRHRDRGGLLRPRLHRLHGRGRHRAAGAQRRPDAAARRRPSCRSTPAARTLKDAINEALRDWVANVDHTAYLLRHRRRPAPVPEHGPRLRPRHRRRGPRPVPRAYRPAARRRRAPASAAGPTRSASSTRSSTTPTSSSTASRPAATASRPAGTPPPSPPATAACCTAPAPTCCRTRTARRSSRTRSRPGSTTRASARSTPTWPTVGRATYQPVTDAEAMDALALLCPHRGHHPGDRERARARRRGRRRERLAEDWAPTRSCWSTSPAAATRTWRPRSTWFDLGGEKCPDVSAMSVAVAFEKARAEGRAALVGYLPAGFPTSRAASTR